MKYVIIGNGAASAGVISGIRKNDREGLITVVSAENEPAYGRPLISYYLEGRTDAEKMKYHPELFSEENGCKVLYGVKAEKLLPEEHRVKLDSGLTLEYDRICICTGSSPFVPPFEGIDTVPERFGFMTFDDARALEKSVKPDSRVLIVGAGLIGLKCAEGLKERAGSITVCDLAPRVLSSILDGECAEYVSKTLAENGITVLTSDTPVRFEGAHAFMKSGKEIDFDILVLAVGVRANIGLVKDAGGECERGIIVDKCQKTSLADVYAAGDCTQGYDASIGAERVLAIMPNAFMQGECAGKNMSGEEAVYDEGIPMNSLGLFGLHMASAGAYTGELYCEKTGSGLKRLYTENGYLKGFIIIGDVSRAGIYTSFVRKHIPLESVDLEILKKNPSLTAFSEKYRSKMLGGVV